MGGIEAQISAPFHPVSNGIVAPIIQRIYKPVLFMEVVLMFASQQGCLYCCWRLLLPQQKETFECCFCISVCQTCSARHALVDTQLYENRDLIETYVVFVLSQLLLQNLGVLRHRDWLWKRLLACRTTLRRHSVLLLARKFLSYWTADGRSRPQRNWSISSLF